MEDLVNKDIRLRPYIFAFWKYKLLLTIFILLSLPVSFLLIKISPKTYSSNSVVEVKQSRTTSSLSAFMPESLVTSSFVLPKILDNQSQAFVPFIKGNIFLSSLREKIAQEDEISKSFNKFCNIPLEYKTNPYSFLGLLEYFNVYKIVPPSAKESREDQLGCLGSMIQVEKYKYKSFSTDAISLIATTGNAQFSADLANLVVEHFFEMEREKQNIRFDETVLLLSGMLAKAEKELKQAQENLKDFLYQNASLEIDWQNFRATGFQVGDLYVELGKLDKNKFFVLQALKLLREVENTASLTDFAKLDTENISSGLRSVIEKLQNENMGATKKTRRIQEEIKKEIERQEELLASLEKSINVKEKEANKNLFLSNTFDALSVSFETKKSYLLGLQAAIQEQITENSFKNIDSNLVHSRASVSSIPDSPNVNLYLAISIILSTSLGLFTIVIKQNREQSVFEIRQLNDVPWLRNRVFLSLKRDFDVKKLGFHTVGENILVGSKFYEKIEKSGRVGCFVQLGQTIRKTNLSDLVAIFLAGLMGKKERGVVCITSKNEQYSNLLRNSEGNPMSNNVLTKHDSSSSPANYVIDDEQTFSIKKGGFSEIIEKHKQANKIFVSAGAQFDNDTKLELIHQSNFFLFVAKLGKFKLGDLLFYQDLLDFDEKNFLGIVLVK